MSNNGKFLCAGAALFVYGSSFFVSPLASQTVPGDPASRDETIPEKKVAKPLEPDQGVSADGLRTGRSESLSDRLDQSNGIISPPKDIDPEIKKPVPVVNPNSTPVIKPAPGINAK